MNEEFIKKVKGKIAKGKVKEVFKEVRSMAPYSSDNIIIALSLRYSLTIREKVKGLIKFEDYSILINLLCDDLLEYLDVLRTLDDSEISRVGEDIISRNLIDLKKNLEEKKILRTTVNGEIDNLSEAIFEIAQKLNNVKTNKKDPIVSKNNAAFVDKTMVVYDNEIFGILRIKAWNQINEIVRNWGILIISILCIIILFLFL